MDNIVEIILQAVDNASDIFSSVTGSAEDMGSTMETAATEASSGFEEIETSASGATGTIQDVIDYCQNLDGSGPQNAAEGMNELEQESNEADEAVKEVGTDLGIIEASNLMQIASEVGQLGQEAENLARSMNEAAVTMEQLSIQTGIAEPELTSMINTITNAAFPHEDAMLYIKSLDQMGVSAENFAQSATDIDAINDAFGLGAQTTNSMAVELGVLGVDLNNVSESFNALAYANANTAGGMENFYAFLRKYDSQFNELGLNVDQAAVAIAGATQKFGGGKAAFTGMNDALKESNGDLGVLEQKLGLASGSLTNASELTGQYSGQLQEMADAEEEHTTLLQQFGDAWDDLSLSVGNALSPLMGVVGVIGQVGQFGLQAGGIVQLAQGFKRAADAIRDFNIIEKARQILVKIGGTITAAWGVIIGILTGEISLVTAATAAWNAILAMNPIILVVGAIILLVAAIYEVGKAFGWWTDVSSMLDAIWDGINRLWQAFINHPDVQAALKAISDALAWIWNGLQQAGQAVLDFFGINTSGNFDIVRALIEGIGKAWEIITLPIRTVITLVQMAATAFGNFYNGTLVPLGDFLQGIFGPVWEWLMDLIGQLAPYVTQVSDAFTAFQEGQLDLPGLIWSILTAVWNAFVTIFTSITTALGNFAMNLLSGALSAGSNFVNGIITWVRQLPGRVWNYMVNTLTRIIAAGVQWVTAARTKANQLVSGVISFLRNLPGRAYSALLGVVSQIVSAGAQWVSSAKQKAMDVVNGAVNTLSELPGKIASALGGVVDAIVKPFKDAYDQAKNLWDQITNLGHAAGGDMPAAGGETLSVGNGVNTYIVEADNSPIVIEDNIKLTLDLQNVPSNISSDGLIEVLSDKNVLSAIANNRDFQDIDARVKQRISLKYGRSRGL